MVKHGKATKATQATHPQKPQKPQKPGWKIKKNSEIKSRFCRISIRTLPLEWCILTTKKQFHEANTKVRNDKLLAALCPPKVRIWRPHLAKTKAKECHSIHLAMSWHCESDVPTPQHFKWGATRSNSTAKKGIHAAPKGRFSQRSCILLLWTLHFGRVFKY